MIAARRPRNGTQGGTLRGAIVPQDADGGTDPAPRSSPAPRWGLDARWRRARSAAPSSSHQACRHVAIDTGFAAHLALDRAVNDLHRRRPDLSAATSAWPWQRRTLYVLGAAGVAGAALAPDGIAFVLFTVLVPPFFCIVVMRATALWHKATTVLRRRKAEPIEIDPLKLPRYTLLIPLYEEADVVADLVAALAAIDYPNDLLQVLLILEENDPATRRAVERLRLPAHMTTVVVPDGRPRTKPRALNYALTRATGDVVVVYDAEDVPEPDQLRRAARLLATSPRLGCVQARLNVLNADETLLTRQFAIEYTVLFDCLLPTLERLRLPVPLGGTSNHFSRAVLEEVGGWDPFNVTEDADLGIRLARAGWDVQVLNSTTWEEAPANFASWRNQRTRWLKGWMQTYLVHMREPARTARDLGWFAFFGLQVLMGGVLLSALVHPWFYAVFLWEIAYGPLVSLGEGAVWDALRWIGQVNLVLGYVTGVALGGVAVAARGRLALAGWALVMPFYWLLISLAAYRALFQLVAAPYHWEKTQHRPRAAYAASSAN
jgi:cellulose synthase/poly-beta-1,6-N-acetylglucosamine synthase-like glycosyltransferase